MKKQIVKVIEAQKEHFFITGWRPFLGWVFCFIILFDFVIAPGLTIALIKAGYAFKAWTPLTLDAAGFFYLGVCSVLTMTSYTRGQEKIEKIKQAAPYDFGTDEKKDEFIGPPL